MSEVENRQPRRRRLRKLVGDAAPRLADALGGPLAGAAVGALARVLLGKPVASEAALERALVEATPAQLEALTAADREFQLAIRRAALEEAALDARDRADARRRQEVMQDWTPCVLGGLIILGFFLVLAAMVARRLPAGAETEFSIMLGALATMTAAVVNYFFGSSAGSREKTRLLKPPFSLDEE